MFKPLVRQCRPTLISRIKSLNSRLTLALPSDIAKLLVWCLGGYCQVAEQNSDILVSPYILLKEKFSLLFVSHGCVDCDADLLDSGTCTSNTSSNGTSCNDAIDGDLGSMWLFHGIDGGSVFNLTLQTGGYEICAIKFSQNSSLTYSCIGSVEITYSDSYPPVTVSVMEHHLRSPQNSMHVKILF